jgi:hypothetical protein
MADVPTAVIFPGIPWRPSTFCTSFESTLEQGMTPQVMSLLSALLTARVSLIKQNVGN